jgi:hypothetical protein
MEIPRSVAVLGPHCFANSNAKRIAFEADSSVERIEESCFTGCTSPLCIRCSVKFIGRFALCNTRLQDIVFEVGSRIGTIEEQCSSRGSGIDPGIPQRWF